MSTLNSPPSESSLFTISPDQKAKYELQFKKICPTGDFVNGQQARELMLQSHLPPAVLAHIWNLADVDADGRMDINEFSIALHLIALKMKGVELPRTLPQSLKVLVEPPPPFAAFNDSSMSNSQQANKSSKSTVVGISPSNSIQQRMGSIGEIKPAAVGPKSAPSPTASVAEWVIPQQSKLKYTQMFNSHDRQRTGFLTGIQARNILLESKLPQTVLAQIWNLSDVDADGRLTCEEFVLAMHLVDKAKRQETLPAKLPIDLIPPSYRRSGSGTLSHASSLDDTGFDHNDLSSSNKSSFEDKRRENYEKGQAELDRRRAALQEQERRAREERERKEREENARKEKERLEAERRRQEEIEVQKQKLREQELEREEQKRRQQEVRELARKEMERQRQRELEQARRSELLAQRSRLMEEVQKLKSRKKVLAIEHEQVNKHLVEGKATAQASRDRVVRIKSEIDGMRVKRDEALAKQSQIKAQMKSLTEKQLFVEQEKVRLAAQLKSLIASTSNGLNPDQQLTSFASILQAKQSQINQLRSQLESMGQEFKTKKEDVINSKQELEKLKRSYQEKRREAAKFSERLEEKRVEAEKVRDGKAQSKFASDSDIAWGQEVPTNFEWPSQMEDKAQDQSINAAVRTKFRYRCIFQFEARNPDEITIKPGDLIMVDTSACSEEGWLSGEIDGKVGWFPKDYAVLEESEQPSGDIDQLSCSASLATSQVTENVTTSIREAKALYDWSSTETGHLSFYKNDRLRITQQQDSWCFGELLNSSGLVTSSGWFPESYVQIISSSSMANNNPAVSASIPQYYISLFAFETVEPGDLGFDVNELIKVEKQDGDWWTGVIVDRTNGQEDPNRRGIFPSNFVGPADSTDIPKTPAETASIANTTISATDTSTVAPPSATLTSKTHQPLDHKESETIADSPKPSKKSKSKKQEIVQAVAAYTATGQEQLSLEVGQLIQVRKKTQTGWWEGELQAKGKKKQIGWFPASYVKPLAPVSGSGSSNRSTPESAGGKSSTTDEPEIERVQTLYPFNAQRDDEISFEKDDIIRVLSKTDSTWWRGHNIRTGSIGLFPSNHVQVLSTATNGQTTKSDGDDSLISAYKQSFDYLYGTESQNNSVNNEQNETEEYFDSNYSFEDDSEDEEYRDVNYPNYDDSYYYDSFLDDNKEDSIEDKQSISQENVHIIEYKNIDNQMDMNKRQNLIYELISSEHDYIKDLYFIIENYMNCIQRSNLLSKKDYDLIFDQIEQIYNVNLMFFKDLSERLQGFHDLHFCDLLFHHLKKMLPCYLKFFSNQIAASTCLQNKIENDPNFESFLKQISIDTKSYLPLSSYLIKPMQRITKYPLLIEKILKYTSSDHADYSDCLEALNFAKKFCTDVNEACRKTDNFDKLHWIQKNVTTPIKMVRRQIEFNSETQFLGPRTLIRYGVLIKNPSSKALVGFLFNDFFMLIRPDKKGLKMQNVTNFFQNKRALEITYTLYRKPLMLDKIQIRDLPDFESQLDPSLFCLYIKPDKTFLNLRAHSSNNCVQWLNDIHLAQQHYMDIWTKLNKNHQMMSHGSSKGSIPIGNMFLTIIEAVKIYTFNPFIDVQCEVAIGKDWNQITTSTFQTAIVSIPKEGKEKLRDHSLKSKSTSSLSSPKSDLVISLASMTNLQGPYRIGWNCDTKFLLYNLDEFLLIRCSDINPFEPRRCLGEQKISLREMCEKSQSIAGTVTQNIQLYAPQNQKRYLNFLDQNDQHCRPSLLIKYKFILNS